MNKKEMGRHAANTQGLKFQDEEVLEKEYPNSQVVVAHTINPKTWEKKAGGSL